MTTKQILIALTILAWSCSTSTKENAEVAIRTPDKTENINDTTICYSFKINDFQTDMVYVSKGDTIANVRYSETDLYQNYIFHDNSGHLIKIKQYLRPIGIKERINEIVYFKADGSIDTLNSTVLTCAVVGDSLCLHADNHSFFNKTRILIGDTNIFERWEWKNPVKFESKYSYLTIPNSFKGKRCVFQRITTNAKGEDDSGYDIYFDTENLICRDLTKSLVCPPKK